MKFFNKFRDLFLIALFLLLSYLKFFTSLISFSNDPTVAIVKTKNIQFLKNTFLIDEDLLYYNWFHDYNFKILHSDEVGNLVQRFYSFLITLWWIILFSALLFGLIKFIAKKNNLYE